jgi:dipeptidyl aminopeptidase/acylaminoacyl peptidase
MRAYGTRMCRPMRPAVRLKLASNQEITNSERASGHWGGAAVMRYSSLVFIALVSLPSLLSADEPAQLKSTPLAQTFGTAPVMWGVQLSPDGSKLSAIQMHPSGTTLARVISLADGTNSVVLSGNQNFVVQWCEWANDERLLCGLRTMSSNAATYFAVTRLVAAKIDGTEMKELITNRIGVDTRVQFTDRIIDWLPDDDDNVLVIVPGDEPGSGSGIARLNVYTGVLENHELAIPGVGGWITDGHGTARLYARASERDRRFLVRATPDSDWDLLHRAEYTDLDDSFSPLGFAESRNELLFFERQDGRVALFAYDLANNRQRRTVYAHPTFDVAGVQTLGRYRRLVAATYVDDRPRQVFFDTRIEAMHRTLTAVFPDKNINITSETEDQRYYLVFVSGATDSGTYYRFDAVDSKLAKITAAYPQLANRTLAPMKPVRYAADDGVEIPAYLTEPANRSGPVPAVILPHGGPSARDYWSYDFLVQFLATNGYAVLQPNYRGSDGYGKEWEGDGAFRGWRRAMADVAAGTDYLVREGIADPEKICMVGWSYGGYAALMSVIEDPDRYRCVVSIAGVTDPKAIGLSSLNFVGGRAAREFIGDDDEVLKFGSPIERAAEIKVPVLLVQPVQDANVPRAQALTFARALERADRDFEFVEYDLAEHSITPERYRTDLLARLGEFLDDNL